MNPLDPARWRVELHLDGLPTHEQQSAIVGHDGTSITSDHEAGLCVVTRVAEARTPVVPLMNAMAILEARAPNLNINAVQITKVLSEEEAVAWVKKQFNALNVSWKSENPF